MIGGSIKNVFHDYDESLIFFYFISLIQEFWFTQMFTYDRFLNDRTCQFYGFNNLIIFINPNE